MTRTGTPRPVSRPTSRPHRPGRWLLCVAPAVALLAPAAPLSADGTCSETAQIQLIACTNEVKDDYWTAVAVCTNEPDPTEREECLAEAAEERHEARQECAEQRAARLDLCEDLGETAYDPEFDPADFDADFSELTNPNPYFPLELAPGPVGNMWQYEGAGEEVTVQVLAKTKEIEGVTCIVVNDVVTEAAEEAPNTPGDVIEDTDDWIAQHVDGTVYYCGELVHDYAYFDGDNPREAELIEIDGSFKAGRDGAKPGVLMEAVPQVGDVYRQEWAVGDAEDAAEVLSTTYVYGADGLDDLVPQELAEAMCNDNPAGPCVVTADFTPLEPDVVERKYYAAGVGLFLEVNLEEGEVVELVGCNFEPCMSLLP